MLAHVAPRYPPGPQRGILPRSLIALRRNPVGFLTRLARDHGDIAHFKLGSQHVYLLNRPEWIKDVLVTHNRNFIKGRGLERAKRLLGEGLLTSEGDIHRRHRRLAQPAFHRDRIAAYGNDMVDGAVHTRERWRDGEPLDVSTEMMELTLGIVARTLFGSSVDSEAGEVRTAMSTMVEVFDLMLLPFSELLERLPLPPTIRFRRTRARLDAIIHRFIEDRRTNGRDTSDLLAMLMLAQDEEGGAEMTDAMLRDEVMTIFLAGHETTANALTWTWYLLSQHPDVDARLHGELVKELGERLPCADDLPRLRYATMVFSESMRLYPPAWVIGRRAISDYAVEGYTIPAGSIVLASQYLMHRDPRYYHDPEAFIPERWNTEEKAARPRFCYFPFGAGPRNCIGESFAWMEGVLLLATIAQRWSMHHILDHRVEMQPLITLRAKYGMAMRPKRR